MDAWSIILLIFIVLFILIGIAVVIYLSVSKGKNNTQNGNTGTVGGLTGLIPVSGNTGIGGFTGLNPPGNTGATGATGVTGITGPSGPISIIPVSGLFTIRPNGNTGARMSVYNAAVGIPPFVVSINEDTLQNCTNYLWQHNTNTGNTGNNHPLTISNAGTFGTYGNQTVYLVSQDGINLTILPFNQISGNNIYQWNYNTNGTWCGILNNTVTNKCLHYNSNDSESNNLTLQTFNASDTGFYFLNSSNVQPPSCFIGS